MGTVDNIDDGTSYGSKKEDYKYDKEYPEKTNTAATPTATFTLGLRKVGRTAGSIELSFGGRKRGVGGGSVAINGRFRRRVNSFCHGERREKERKATVS